MDPVVRIYGSAGIEVRSSKHAGSASSAKLLGMFDNHSIACSLMRR